MGSAGILGAAASTHSASPSFRLYSVTLDGDTAMVSLLRCRAVQYLTCIRGAEDALSAWNQRYSHGPPLRSQATRCSQASRVSAAIMRSGLSSARTGHRVRLRSAGRRRAPGSSADRLGERNDRHAELDAFSRRCRDVICHRSRHGLGGVERLQRQCRQCPSAWRRRRARPRTSCACVA